jgi:hypothetical protein
VHQRRSLRDILGAYTWGHGAVITHTHKGIKHRQFTCPNTCELGDPEATPVNHVSTLAPLGKTSTPRCLVCLRRPCDCKSENRPGTVAGYEASVRALELEQKGKPVGRVGTMPGMPAPQYDATQKPLQVNHVAVHVDERGRATVGQPPPLPKRCDCPGRYDDPPVHASYCASNARHATPEAMAQGTHAVLTHEVNKHLRTFLALTPEHRTLVANVALALRKGVGE